MELIVYSYLADLIFGDPRWFPHPVRGIGKLITFLEKKLNGAASKQAQRFNGVILTLIVIVISAGAAYLVMESLTRINLYLGRAAGVLIAYTTLSARDLFVHVKAVEKEIIKGDIERARDKLSRIVGRDTKNLSRREIVCAAVETTAENTCDGIIAPLFYLFVAGPVGAVIYKAINTLDSMLGYKNERYIHLGWFCAKLDDAANFIPARITGVLISLAAFILGKSGIRSFKIMRRDAGKHFSPNSGYPEAAMAGALGVRLGGRCFYQGELSQRPYIGDEKKEVKPVLIREAVTISFVVSLLMVLAGGLVRWAV